MTNIKRKYLGCWFFFVVSLQKKIEICFVCIQEWNMI